MTTGKKVVAVAAVAAVAILLVWHFRSNPPPPPDTKTAAQASETAAPPAVPLPVAPASAATLPGTNNYEWGLVKEVTLSSDREGHDYVLDLDTGRVFTPAQEMQPQRLSTSALKLPLPQCDLIWRGYLYGQGVDIINEQNLAGLVTCDLVLEGAGDAGKLDSLSAKELVHAAGQFRKLPAPLDRGMFSSKNRQVPPAITFLFRTREGRLGIFQVTEIQHQPKKVTIRYKLVQESGQSAPSTESGVQNPSGQ